MDISVGAGDLHADEEHLKPSFLPPFANDANKREDVYIRTVEKQLDLLDASLEEKNGRIEVMSDHLKNVQQEITYTESRLDVERKEVETEKHLKIMSEKEMSRITGDIQQLEKERLELEDRASNLQQQIFKGSEKLDQFKLLMNWNQEELEQWALAQKQKEEDNTALEKYRHQDEAKMKELGLAVEKLTKEVAAKKAAVEAEVTETQTAQIQLDRAAEDFRQLHEERQQLIKQWDEAIEAMKRRDEAVQVLSEQFADKRVVLRQRRADLDNQARFLEAEVANNKELESRITLYEREVAKQRSGLVAEQARLQELEQQLELAKASLSKASHDLATKATTTEAAKEQVGIKRKRLEVARKRHVALKQKLEGEFGQLDTLESKVAALEAMRKAEAANLKALQKENEDLKKEQSRQSQVLFQLRQKEKELLSEIAGGQSQDRNLAGRLLQLDQQVARQQELLYNVDFNLQDAERRVARAQGHQTEDESRALQARIAALTEVLDGVNSEHAMLLEQVRAVELNLGDARRANGRLTVEMDKLNGQLSGLALETDSCSRAFKLAVAEKEKALVDHDVLKLQVKRLKDVLYMAADEVYSLETRKARLKLSLDERKQEIEVHRDGLRCELKLVKEDCHRITLELKDRGLKVDKLAAKFEAVVSKNRATDEEGGEPKSQAYYIIKAGQQREELQRKGDQLDKEISKSEAHVAALQSTLGQMQSSNISFSHSLKGASPSAGRAMQDLRDRLDISYDRLKALRIQEGQLREQISAEGASSSSRDQEQEGIMAGLQQLSRRAAEAAKHVVDQQEKEQRAKMALERGQKQLRRSSRMEEGGESPSADGGTREGADGCSSSGSGLDEQVVRRLVGQKARAEEKDFCMAELKETTRTMLQELRALAAAHPDAGIQEALEAAGFRLPKDPGSTPSSRAGSLSGSNFGSRAGSLKSMASGKSLGSSTAGGAKGTSSRGNSRVGSPAAGATRSLSIKTMSLGS